MHTCQWHLGSRVGSRLGSGPIVTPGASDARLPSFRQEEKPSYKAECTGILHHRCAFAGKRGSHEDHEKRERGREERERERKETGSVRVRNREEGVLCMSALLPLLKKLPTVRKKKCLRHTLLKPRLNPDLH